MGMSKKIILGIVITIALAVVALFFIANFYNPFSMLNNQSNPLSEATSTPSNGLVVQDTVVGPGPVAQPGDILTVNYTGKLQDGTVFDSSIGKQPFQFTLGVGQVIPGWDEGLVGMKVGGTRTLIIPPDLGYGAQAVGSIPANSTLVFNVQLLSVSSATSTQTGK